MTLLLNPIFSLNDGGIYWIFASVIEVYPNDVLILQNIRGFLDG